MTRATWIKLVLGGIGLFIWALGARSDHSALRWVGIALVAAAFVARFILREPGIKGRRR